MEMCFQILLQEKRVTQRELFYKLLCDSRSPDYFPSQWHVNRTIQDLAALLRCNHGIHERSSCRPPIAADNHLSSVDMIRNQAGLAILCTYKCGSRGMGLEAYRYGTPS